MSDHSNGSKTLSYFERVKFNHGNTIYNSTSGHSLMAQVKSSNKPGPVIKAPENKESVDGTIKVKTLDEGHQKQQTISKISTSIKMETPHKTVKENDGELESWYTAYYAGKNGVNFGAPFILSEDLERRQETCHFTAEELLQMYNSDSYYN